LQQVIVRIWLNLNDDNFLIYTKKIKKMSDSTKNGAASAGLVLGIISLLGWIIPLIGAPISIIGLVQSVRGQKSENQGQATTGLILNMIGLVATIINASIGAFKGAHGY